MTLNKELIHLLAEVKSEYCASIYLTKQYNAASEIYEIDQLRLQSALADCKEQLTELGMDEEEAALRTQQVQKSVLGNTFFSRYSPGTVSIFFAPGSLEFFEIPDLEIDLSYLGREFYLRPLLPLLSGMGRYFLLSLTDSQLRLFEGLNQNLAPVNMQRILPHDGASDSAAGDVVVPAGKDLHDHLKRIFQRLDDGVLSLLSGSGAPLILAGPDALTVLYRENSRYPLLQHPQISHHPQHDSLDALMQKAWPIAREFFQHKKVEKRKAFIEQMLQGKASISLREIVAAAVEGRVHTLMLDRAERWTGTYKPAIKYVEVDDEIDLHSRALFNFAAVQTFLQGGEVYDLERDELPDRTTSINAIYRY